MPNISSHVKTVNRLFREVIHSAVYSGKFLYGGIDLVDASCTQVYPVTCCRNFHDSIKMIKMPQPGEFVYPDPVLQVIREKQHIICNKIDWLVGECGSFALARPNCRSTATFPLVIGDQIAGIFQVISGEAGSFWAAEIHILAEIAGRVSSALKQIEDNEKIIQDQKSQLTNDVMIRNYERTTGFYG